MVRPSASAFFDRRPARRLPLRDRRLVALGRPLERLLDRPAERAQQPADVGRVVADPELPLDDRRHPFGGPAVAAEAERLGAALQHGGQAVPLLGAQLRRPPR
jgi:hypothetical protein